MRILLFIFTFLLLSTSSQAATITWGGTNGNWANPANWNGGIAPGVGDEVIVPSGRVSIRNYDVVDIAEINIQPGAELVVTKNATLNIINSANNGIYNRASIKNYGTINIYSTTTHGISTNNGSFFNGKNGIITIGITSIGDVGIWINNTTFTNRGKIIIENSDAAGIAAYSSVFNNSGTIDIGVVELGITCNSNTVMNNTGTINIDNTEIFGISCNSGSIFTNETTGVIDIGHTEIGTSGIYNTAGSVCVNRGTISIQNTLVSAISNIGDLASFTNETIGIINITSNTSQKGIYNLINSIFTNRGKITIEGDYSSGIYNNSNSTFTNTECAAIYLYSKLNSSASFINDGYFFQDYDGTNSIDLSFINYGVIEDRQGSFYEYFITNFGYLIPPITSTIIENTPISPVLFGSSIGLSVTNNKFYTDNTLTTSAGDYIPSSIWPNNNSWTPNANAVGLNIFYMEIIDSDGCPVIVEIHVEGVSALQASGGYAFEQSSFSLPIEKMKDVHFSAYPNPSSGQLYLQTDHALEQAIDITIVNTNGQQVFQKTIDFINSSRSILENTPSFTPGIYFLLAKQDGLLIWQEKIVFIK